MFSRDDTIVAIATPPGRGGIGVVRISGPDAPGIARRLLDRAPPLRPRHATFTRVVTPAPETVGGAAVRRPEPGRALDQVVATYFPRPASYTGEDVIELCAHGSPVVLRQILCAALAAGARQAEPGEFTFRAFLNGRIDLVQAEAVADLIDAVTPLQARVAFDQLEGTLTECIRAIHAALFELTARLEASLDFPDEGYHFIEPASAAAETDRIVQRLDALLAQAATGRLIREGRQVGIAGRVNVGKSSIFNKLTGASRAIVTPGPGTTRDLLTEVIDLAGAPITLVDMAGLRRTGDPVEREGIARARRTLDVADVVVLVLDRASPLEPDDFSLIDETRGLNRIVVANKVDRPAAWDTASVPATWGAILPVSALRGDGLDRLRDAMIDALGSREALREDAALTNVRHIRLLERARDVLRCAWRASAAAASEEYVLADLQEARVALEEVTGARTPEDVLAHIFERFCIGK